MNPRDLPEEEGLGRPIPRPESPAQKQQPDVWKPYGEKGSQLEQNSRTGELRTARPVSAMTTYKDARMLIADYMTPQGEERWAAQPKQPSISLSETIFSEAEQSLRSGKGSKDQDLLAPGAFSAHFAETSGHVSLSMVEKVVRLTLQLEYGNAPSDHAESTAMAVYQALQSGGQTTSLRGTKTGQTQPGDTNACSSSSLQEQKTTDLNFPWRRNYRLPHPTKGR